MEPHNHHQSNNIIKNVISEVKISEIELRDDEIICNKCDGTGNDPTGFWGVVCPKCQGERKLDWISAATGVAPKEHSHLHGSGCYTSGVGISRQMLSSTNHTYSHHMHKFPCKIEQSEIEKESISSYLKKLLSRFISERIEKEIMNYFKK